MRVTINALPRDDRIPILQEPCKISFKSKNKSGYKCFRKQILSKLLFIKHVIKAKPAKKYLARIQYFWPQTFVSVSLEATAEHHMK